MPGPSVEDRIEQLSAIEAFSPPADFAAQAQVRDPGDYGRAAADGPAWWAEQARQRLDWHIPFSAVLDDSNPPFYSWFADGTLNVSHNCLDRHVLAGRGDRVAFHWRGEEGEERDLTYAELLAQVQRMASGLKARGTGKGDVVGIYLPMVPEVVVAMLACARIGAPHTVIFGGFAPSAARERLAVSAAKALITADGARRKGRTFGLKAGIDEVVGDLATLETVVVVRSAGSPCAMRPGRDVWYDELLAGADPECPAELMAAEHPLFLLYSSGSTAEPKGIVHTTGGYLTGVTTTTAMVFDLDPERVVFWCTADVGWITGHSYIVYGPMANGCTSVMFEGAPDYPDKDIWWEIIERYSVSVFYTAPTAIRACMKLRTLYRDPDRFVQTYFARFGPRVYVVGDGARRDTDGYFWITGRIDDVINVSGHRLSTAEIESALVAHPAVAEAAVIATSDELTGQAVVAYVTLGQGSAGGPPLEAELRDHIAGRIGKLARPKQIIWAEDLPKTRSGKIMRRLLRDIAEGREPGDVTTLCDASVLDALQYAISPGGTGT